MMANLLPVPVLLAIFGAAVALALPRRPATQRVVSVLSLSGIVPVVRAMVPGLAMVMVPVVVPEMEPVVAMAQVVAGAMVLK